MMNRIFRYQYGAIKGRWVACLLVTILSSAALAGELDAGQQKLLGQAKSHLKQTQSNLKLAQESAGRGKAQPKGSKAKLAMLRLNSAKQSASQVTARLAKLPADNASVQAVQQQLSQTHAAIEQLQTRITGRTAQQNKLADTGVKLDYKQVEQLKNARFYYREIQGMAQSLEQLIAKLRPVKDQRLINHRKVQAAMNTMAKAAQRIKQMKSHMEPLPADGRGVKAMVNELNATVASLGASYKFLQPIYKKLMVLVNPGSYPQLADDAARLRDLTRMYSNVEIFQTNRSLAAQVMSEVASASAERDRIVKKYALLIYQQTAEGVRLDKSGKYFNSQSQRFTAEAKKYKQLLSVQIKDDMDKVRTLAKEAVEKKKPAYFTGGIPQQLEWVQDKLVLFDVLDPKLAKVFQAGLAQLREELKQGQASLRQEIIATNNLPPDQYTEDDRKAVEQFATDAWKKIQPNAKILKIRIPSKQWKHEILWRRSGDTLYKIDRSKIQVQLIVQHDSKLAAIQPIDLWKNHLSNNEVKAYPFFNKDSQLKPSDLMLIEKVK